VIVDEDDSEDDSEDEWEDDSEDGSADEMIVVCIRIVVEVSDTVVVLATILPLGP